jgi:hypothetical protein
MPFSPVEPTTKWLSLPSKNDRDMLLLEDFTYTDPQGVRWLAPRHSTINGASIPSALWTTVGSPYTGAYRRASIVHDVACVNARTDNDRLKADRMFYDACIDGGCSKRQANLLYMGVRIGAWWSPPSSLTATAAGMQVEGLVSKGPQTDESVKVFKAVQKKLGRGLADATPEQIDELVKKEVSRAKLAEAAALAAPNPGKKKLAVKKTPKKAVKSTKKTVRKATKKKAKRAR